MLDVLMAEMSAVAVVLLSLMTHAGVFGNVAFQFKVTADTLAPDTIEPRVLVEPAVIDEQPVPHVGVPPPVDCRLEANLMLPAVPFVLVPAVSTTLPPLLAPVPVPLPAVIETFPADAAAPELFCEETVTPTPIVASERPVLLPAASPKEAETRLTETLLLLVPIN